VKVPSIEDEITTDAIGGFISSIFDPLVGGSNPPRPTNSPAA